MADFHPAAPNFPCTPSSLQNAALPPGSVSASTQLPFKLANWEPESVGADGIDPSTFGRHDPNRACPDGNRGEVKPHGAAPAYTLPVARALRSDLEPQPVRWAFETPGAGDPSRSSASEPVRSYHDGLLPFGTSPVSSTPAAPKMPQALALYAHTCAECAARSAEFKKICLQHGVSAALRDVAIGPTVARTLYALAVSLMTTPSLAEKPHEITTAGCPNGRVDVTGYGADYVAIIAKIRVNYSNRRFRAAAKKRKACAQAASGEENAGIL